MADVNELLRSAGQLIAQGDLGEAERTIASARTSLVPQPQSTAMAEVLLMQGQCARLQGRFAEALRALGQAEGLCRELGIADRGAEVLLQQGQVMLEAGEYGEALEHFRRALVVSPRDNADELRHASRVLRCLGMVSVRLREFDAAHDYFERALELSRQLEDPSAIASNLNSLGVLLCRQAELQPEGSNRREALVRASLPYYEEALAMVGGDLNPRLEAQTHGNVGRAHGMLGEPEVLLQAQRRCCDLFRRFGARRDEALSLLAIGEALLQLGPLEEARQTLEHALELAEQHRFKAEVGGALDLLSVAYERSGDLDRALAALKRCRAIEGELRDDEARSAVRRLAESDELRRARLEVEDQRRRAAESDRRALEDALTGVANRRALENWLQANRALERDCAVAILDVDRFKSINDLHSHAIGDRVLQSLAAVLGQHHRAADLLARYGGEEFVFVLPGVSLADAVGSCERLRRAIEAHDWSAIAPGLAVTASIGVAVAPAGGSAAAALEAADRRLRLAKRAGRNRTVSAP